jgi:small-conductance mechanosensitive channel
MHVSIGIAAESGFGRRSAADPRLTHAEAVAELKRLQSEQDRVKQLASSASGDIKLSDLNDDTEATRRRCRQARASLTPQRAQLQAQVDLLGPPPDAGKAKEAPAVVRSAPNSPRARRSSTTN